MTRKKKPNCLGSHVPLNTTYTNNPNTNLTNMLISKLTLKLTKPRSVPLKLAQEAGTLTNENIARLSSLHKYLKRHLKKITFIKNKIKKKTLSTLSSYYIFTARKNETWDHTAFINPPSRNITITIQ